MLGWAGEPALASKSTLIQSNLSCCSNIFLCSICWTKRQSQINHDNFKYCLVFILNRKHEEIEGNCVLLEIFFVLSCSLKIYKRILFEKISKSNTHWWKTCLFHTATSLFIFVVAKKRRRKEDLKMKWVSSKLPLNQWFKCESHLLLGQMRIQWI